MSVIVYLYTQLLTINWQICVEKVLIHFYFTTTGNAKEALMYSYFYLGK